MRPTRIVSTGIFLAVFGVYMLSSSRERPWADANPVYQVADSIVDHGGFDVASRWPVNAPTGRNGHYYAANPLLPSLLQVPGVVLRDKINKIVPWAPPLSLPMTCHLGPAAMGALACLLFFALCRHHGAGPGVASLFTLLLGFGTTVWVYARYPYTEILQLACFTGYFLSLVRALDVPGRRAALMLGVWAALLVNTKLINILALPGAAGALAWTLRDDLRRLLKFAAWTAGPLSGGAAMILFYNWARWGSVWNSGYSEVGAAFSRGDLAGGLWGMFFSFGKSIFLYSPPLLLGMAGLGVTLRRHPRTILALTVTAVPMIVTYAQLPFWSGDWAWGPRYLTLIVPVMLLPGCVLAQEMMEKGRRGRLALVVGALLALGIYVQTMGNVFYWDHFIRISKEAQVRWLGNPNRSGAASADHGDGCDACFEDTYSLLWLPPMQPIAGHRWLLPHVEAGDDWKTAVQDAPWTRYTTTVLDISGTYRRARLDWWKLDYGGHGGAAWSLLAMFAALGLLGSFLWWRGARRLVPAPPQDQ